jgi:hypothetical protein
LFRIERGFSEKSGSFIVIYCDYAIIIQRISFLGREFFDDLKFLGEYEGSETVVEEV